MASAARNGAAAAALMVAVSILALASGGSAQLQYGFYKGKCNGTDVEAVVQSIVRARFARENPIVAYLLRMQFHECAVNVRVRAIATPLSTRVLRWFVNNVMTRHGATVTI